MFTFKTFEYGLVKPRVSNATRKNISCATLPLLPRWPNCIALFSHFVSTSRINYERHVYPTLLQFLFARFLLTSHGPLRKRSERRNTGTRHRFSSLRQNKNSMNCCKNAAAPGVASSDGPTFSSLPVLPKIIIPRPGSAGNGH